VPIYVYRCDCGLRFERLMPRDAEAPACPDCGRATRKIPAGAGLGGRADVAPAPGRGTPQAQGLRTGGPERVQREVQFRQRLEAKHTETKQAQDPRPGGGTAAPPSAD
jgi:putative FmdB family regulatory protein